MIFDKVSCAHSQIKGMGVLKSKQRANRLSNLRIRVTPALWTKIMGLTFLSFLYSCVHISIFYQIRLTFNHLGNKILSLWLLFTITHFNYKTQKNLRVIENFALKSSSSTLFWGKKLTEHFCCDVIEMHSKFLKCEILVHTKGFISKTLGLRQFHFRRMMMRIKCVKYILLLY